MFVCSLCWFCVGFEVENRQETLRIGDSAGVGLKLLGYGSTVPTKFEQRERRTDREDGMAWNCFWELRTVVGSECAVSMGRGSQGSWGRMELFFFEIVVSVNVGEAVVEIAVSVLEIRSKAVSELRVAGVHGSEFTGRTVAERRQRNPQ